LNPATELQRGTDSLQLFLIARLNRLLSDPARLREAQLPGGVAAAYLLNKLDGKQGNSIGVRFLVFVGAFCLAGAADAAWRVQFVGVARRRYVRAGDVLDNGMLRLMRISRLNDGTLLLQLGAAAFFAWHIH
jgi:hypothetical protein